MGFRYSVAQMRKEEEDRREREGERRFEREEEQKIGN